MLCSLNRPPISSPPLTNNTTCTSAAQGSIAVTASGGTGTKVYSKDNGTTYQGASLFSALANGTYTVMTKDANGCLSGTSSYTIITSGGISFTTTIVNPNPCLTGANGKITVLASGGSGYFNYSKDGGSTWQSSNVFTALHHGTFSMQVRDVLGCISGISVIVVGPACREESITTNSSYSFSIYPNPATNQATVVFNSSTEEKYTVTMIDVMGRTVINSTNTAVVGENQIQINLSNIAKGIYSIILQKGDGMMQQKIVVE